MTTTPVMSITNEQIAEIENYVNLYSDPVIPPQVSYAEIAALIARLRAAEKDVATARQRIKELDLLFGRYLLGMKAAVIEMDHGRGAEYAMQWIVNGLMGPGELPPEGELDAQAFFDREIKPIDDSMAEIFESRRAAMTGEKP